MQKLVKKYTDLPIQVKASMWFFVCAFLQKGISFITTPIFTRLLSTSEYGQYNVYTSWMSVLIVIVTLNLYCGVYSRGLVKFFHIGVAGTDYNTCVDMDSNIFDFS